MKLNASLTVEAALLVPFVTMILFALILLMLFAHDAARDQAAADGEAELAVMAEEGSADTGVIDRLRCIRHAQVKKEGAVNMPHGGIRALTGGALNYSADAHALRVVYVEDFFLQKLKSGWQRDKTDSEGSN